MDFKWHQSRKRKLGYTRRDPLCSTLYRVVYNLHEKLEHCWEERYQQRYGAFRHELREAFHKFLDCGVLSHGCARAVCENDNCKHSKLIPLSCKCRGICPSCETKRMLLFAEHMHEETLKPVPHRHLVLTLPKMLRAFFRYDRSLNDILFTATRETVFELYAELYPEGKSAIITALHCINDLIEFNPHTHSIIPDGVFMPDGSFTQLSLDVDAIQKLFEHKVLFALKQKNLITDTLIAQLNSWKHSGFSAWLGPQIKPEQQGARLFISEYVNKAQIKLNRIEIIEKQNSEHTIIRCHKDKNTSKDYSPMDFLAAVSATVPDKWEQSVRYAGYYASKTKGKRRELEEKKLAEQVDADDNDNIRLIKPPPEQKKKASRSWVRLIRKVYEADPLTCPKCGENMKVIAVITDPKQATRIATHLGTPPYRAPPPFISDTNSAKQLQFAA